MNRFKDNYQKLKKIAKHLNDNFKCKIKLNVKKQILSENIEVQLQKLSCKDKISVINNHYEKNSLIYQWHLQA